MTFGSCKFKHTFFFKFTNDICGKVNNMYTCKIDCPVTGQQPRLKNICLLFDVMKKTE